VALRPHLSMGLPFRSQSLSLLRCHELHHCSYSTQLCLACLSADLSNSITYTEVIPIHTSYGHRVVRHFSGGSDT
jgi:hypothetical protein